MTAVPQEMLPTMLGRATLILDVFEDPERRLTLGQVAVQTGLPRSTAHRILDQLVGLDWLSHTDGGYLLGRRGRTWGRPGRPRADLQEVAAPELARLAGCGGAVHLGRLDGGDVVLLAGRGDGAGRVGTRRRAERSALGRAALATLTPEEVDDRVSGADLAQLYAELHRARRTQLVCRDVGGGLVAVASPVAAGAALELVVPAGRADRLGPLARAAACRVREALGA